MLKRKVWGKILERRWKTDQRETEKNSEQEEVGGIERKRKENISGDGRGGGKGGIYRGGRRRGLKRG